jgi:hypothetical protein
LALLPVTISSPSSSLTCRSALDPARIFERWWLVVRGKGSGKVIDGPVNAKKRSQVFEMAAELGQALILAFRQWVS